MKEFHTQDGTIIHLPDARQRKRDDVDDTYWCSCHKRLGNDFYFLPITSCLRPDKTCNSPRKGVCYPDPARPGLCRDCDEGPCNQ
jgi:hypothetical protein